MMGKVSCTVLHSPVYLGRRTVESMANLTRADLTGDGKVPAIPLVAVEADPKEPTLTPEEGV